MLPVAFAQVCGDNSVDAGEECDGTDDSNCPGMCDNSNCVCEKDSDYVMFDLGMAHNLLFSKVQDLLHIIKHSIFQLELKVVEIQLTNFDCDQQPVSFWMPADLNPYGKLNEIDALVELLIQGIDDGEDANAGAFGSPDTGTAASLLSDADGCITAENYREAFECKCLAYDELQSGGTDVSVTCDPCGGGPVL